MGNTCWCSIFGKTEPILFVLISGRRGGGRSAPVSRNKMKIMTPLKPRWKSAVLWGFNCDVGASGSQPPGSPAAGRWPAAGICSAKQIQSWENVILLSFWAHISQEDKWGLERKTTDLELRKIESYFLKEPEDRLLWFICPTDVEWAFGDSEHDQM